MNSPFRAAFGLVIAALSLALVLLAVGQVYQALSVAGSEAPEARKPKTRTYKVAVETLEAVNFVPTIAAYGRVESANTLVVRSDVAGEITHLADHFVSGGTVHQGDLLFQIDPSRLETALALAKVDLQEALADVAEAESALELTLLEVDSARTQLELRRSALARQQDLQKRGLTTNSDVDAAILAFSVAEQTLIGRTQLKAQNEAKLEQSKIAVERRQIALNEAERTLKDASFYAPFDGILANVSGVLGGTVSVNEKLADLIDPNALEIPFRVTNTQFSRLLNDQGNLRKVELTASLQTGRQRFDLVAKLDRVSAEVGEGQVGRLVYARINADQPNLVMPGDFVSLSIPERQLQDVFLLPATAITADGRVLLLGEGNRLIDQPVNVIRQQGDQVVVKGLNAGDHFVVARAPELGSGVTVETVAATESALSVPQSSESAEPDTIALDDERRAKLIAFVEGNEGMQAASKERVLAELAKPEVSREVVEKFEAKMAEQ